MLLAEQQWVTYPRYTDREGWKNFLGENREYYIRKGEARLGYLWQPIKASDYIAFKKTGDRNIMQKPHFENLAAYSDLLMAELAEGKGRFMEQLINGTTFFCEMTSWVLSAHLYLQKEQRLLPDYREAVIDLSVGYTGAMLAWSYYFLHEEFDKVHPVISMRLYDELNKRVMKPYLEQNRFWWMAINAGPERMVNNWNPWCNSNVLQCFMLVEKDKIRLQKAVVKSMFSVDGFLNYVRSDGACEEGASYWDHAAGKLFDYLQLLSLVTDGKIAAYTHPMVRRMGEYIACSYIGNGWVVNFADASAKQENVNASLIFRYGKAIESPLMQNYAALSESYNHDNGNDIFRTLEALRIQKDFATYVPDDIQKATYCWYPETEVYYRWAERGWFMAAKGGNNGESHNHNDVGNFILYCDKIPFIVDAGVGTYTAKTFGKDRYSIWTMQSDYHNLPVINGVSQTAGRSYKASSVKASRKAFELDLANAYPKEAGVSSWKREYVLKRNALYITDSYELEFVKTPVLWNLLVCADSIDCVSDGCVLLRNGNKVIAIEYDSAEFALSKEAVDIADKKLYNVWKNKLCRLIFNAKSLNKKGIYKFKISEY